MTHILQRNDLAAVWTSTNPVLLRGEVGWERDTLKAKIGDGSTAWNSLPYAVSTPNLAGLAPLDSPALTGTPTAPTRLPASDGGDLATTAFVRNSIAGQVNDLGNTSGTRTLAQLGSYTSLVNGVVRFTLTGNLTLDATAGLPGARPGTQFVLVAKQDATGSRLLTLTGFKKPGTISLSEEANSTDILVFFFDGVDWFASLSGKGYA